MKILVVCHKHIYSLKSRGGEFSVRAIVAYLRERNHAVEVIDTQPTELEICRTDLVLTWGSPALEVAKSCEKYGRPLVLMLRFWRNLCPLPAGDLLSRPVDRQFTQAFEPLFVYASAVITNSHYAKEVIARWQPAAATKTVVSYVPITGEFRQSGDENGFITVVTPEIYGEYSLIKRISPLLKDERFLIVNCTQVDQLHFADLGARVFPCSYADMEEVFEKTKILLVPVYHNDICGTRRVTIEAFRHGIPVIATDRSGMREKVPADMLVRRNAGKNEWIAKIHEIERKYPAFQALAREAWESYYTAGELRKFEQVLLECAGVQDSAKIK